MTRSTSVSRSRVGFFLHKPGINSVFVGVSGGTNNGARRDGRTHQTRKKIQRYAFIFVFLPARPRRGGVGPDPGPAEERA